MDAILSLNNACYSVFIVVFKKSRYI